MFVISGHSVTTATSSTAKQLPHVTLKDCSESNRMPDMTRLGDATLDVQDLSVPNLHTKKVEKVARPHSSQFQPTFLDPFSCIPINPSNAFLCDDT